MEREIWLQVDGFPDYFVSNFGRIKSVKFGKIRLLKQSKSKGYYRVNLCQSGGRYAKKVAFLVLEAFSGKRPEGLDCSHLDGNRENNRLDNLEWETRTVNNRRKENVKLTALKVIQIRILAKSGKSQMELALEFGVSQPTISLVVRGIMWRFENE